VLKFIHSLIVLPEGANDRVEDNHLPFRQRKRAMLKSGRMKSLQKFATVNANVRDPPVRDALRLTPDFQDTQFGSAY
jgi:hypothetical protein